MRISNLDLLKGVLILLVVAGHLLEEPLSESLPRYLIYAFHMPVFLGIAGFLFDYEKSGQRKLSEFLGKLLVRVALPWTAAVLAYCFILEGHHLGEPRVFLRKLAESFSYPYFHLWFIPAYVVSLSDKTLARLPGSDEATEDDAPARGLLARMLPRVGQWSVLQLH